MKKPNVFMVVENNFPDDIRVRREAFSLKDLYNITVLALRKKGEKTLDNINGIKVIRIPEFPNWKIGSSIYVLQYIYITVISLLVFLATHPFRRYKIIHAHNPPDTLFALGFFGKLFGTKFIYDLHDLSPELFLSRISPKKNYIYKALELAEKFSCNISNCIITTNESYKELMEERHKVPPKKIHIIRNDPDPKDFGINNKPSQLTEDSLINLIFVGAINPQDGLDLLVDIVGVLVQEKGINNILCRVVGKGDSLPDVIKLVEQNGLEKHFIFEGFVGERDKVGDYLHLADIGIEPAPENPLNNRSTFIKIMEYMVSGLPIVAFDLKETRFSANSCALLVKPGDIEGFASAIVKLIDNPGLRKNLGDRGINRIKNDLNWGKASKNLTSAYEAALPND